MNSAEAFSSLREEGFYHSVKGAIAGAVRGSVRRGAQGPDDPRVLRRLIAARYDGPGAWPHA